MEALKYDCLLCFFDPGHFANLFSLQLTISGEKDAETVGLAIVNTIIGGSCGGLSALLIARTTCIKDQKWSYLLTLNGALTGNFIPLHFQQKKLVKIAFESPSFYFSGPKK